MQSGELIFFEIGVDPEVVRRNDREQIGALRRIGADLSGAVADIAVNRRTDFSITKIESRGLQIGLRLRNRSTRLGDLRVEHIELLFCCRKSRLT